MSMSPLLSFLIAKSMMQDPDYEYEELVGTSLLFNGVNYPYWELDQETDTHKPPSSKPEHDKYHSTRTRYRRGEDVSKPEHNKYQ